MIDTAFGELEPIVGTKGACEAVGRPRSSHYRHRRPPLQGPPAPRPAPANALSAQERAAVRAVLLSARFVDRAPEQVWATLLDEGTYLGSPSTMYRVLRAHDEVRERRRQAVHPPRAIPELVATGPCQVWSYDATALRGPRKGVWYRLFVMLDLFSRFCPGWMVVPDERAELVADWIGRVVALHGPAEPGRLTIHSDRGTAMTSRSVTRLLADLAIERTHSRPRVSNDNPYSESAFKTIKHAPDFPERFGSIQDARAFSAAFLDLSRYAGDAPTSRRGRSGSRHRRDRGSTWASSRAWSGRRESPAAS